MLVDIASFVAGMVMVLTRDLFLPLLVTVTVLILIAWLVVGVIVMLTGFVLDHGNLRLIATRQAPRSEIFCHAGALAWSAVTGS